MEELINNKVFADCRQGVILQCNHCGKICFYLEYQKLN